MAGNAKVKLVLEVSFATQFVDLIVNSFSNRVYHTDITKIKLV